jgi:pyrimidine 5'-nucleotidase
MSITTVFFDLDDTLYPASSGLWRAIKDRIGLYMLERLHIPADQIATLRTHYYETYGTALRGLEREYPLDKTDFLAYVHDLPLADYIGPTLGLRAVIEALPARKFIFTNADSAHANRVLTTLGLVGCFDGIIDVLAVSPHCKPMPESFELALKLAGNPASNQCAILDDLPRTICAARQAGIFSILVSETAPTAEVAADAVLTNWQQLPSILANA